MTSWVPFLHGTVILSLPEGCRSGDTSEPSSDRAALCAPSVCHETLTGTSPLWQWTADFIDSEVIVGAGATDGEGDASPPPESDEQAASATTQAAATIRGVRMARAYCDTRRTLATPRR